MFSIVHRGFIDQNPDGQRQSPNVMRLMVCCAPKGHDGSEQTQREWLVTTISALRQSPGTADHEPVSNAPSKLLAQPTTRSSDIRRLANS